MDDLFIDVYSFKRRYMIPLIDDKYSRTVTLNIRYLCWKKSKDRDRWPALLASWLGKEGGIGKSETMLSDMVQPTTDDIRLIRTELNLDEGEFVYAPMHVAEGVNVLHEI